VCSFRFCFFFFFFDMNTMRFDAFFYWNLQWQKWGDKERSSSKKAKRKIVGVL